MFTTLVCRPQRALAFHKLSREETRSFYPASQFEEPEAQV